MSGDELELVEWLSQQWRPDPCVELGIGDDLAIVRWPQTRAAVGEVTPPRMFLIGSDMLLDGVHFDLSKHSPYQIGRKAVACNLSDCAAMAVRPLAAVVSAGLPADLAFDGATELFRGMFSIADEHKLAIVGGDVTSWRHPLVLDVAITATAYEGVAPVRRSGARPGDALYVTGPLGGSLLGKHLRFRPRVDESLRLVQHLGGDLHAMMDISDGLALDLWRLTQASGVGAVLEESCVEAVISDDARRASARDGRTPLEHALTDGEDFELLLAAGRLIDAPPVPVHRIGRVTEGGLRLQHADGSSAALSPRGYVH